MCSILDECLAFIKRHMAQSSLTVQDLHFPFFMKRSGSTNTSCCFKYFLFLVFIRGTRRMTSGRGGGVHKQLSNKPPLASVALTNCQILLMKFCYAPEIVRSPDSAGFFLLYEDVPRIPWNPEVLVRRSPSVPQRMCASKELLNVIGSETRVIYHPNINASCNPETDGEKKEREGEKKRWDMQA